MGWIFYHAGRWATVDGPPDLIEWSGGCDVEGERGGDAEGE